MSIRHSVSIHCDGCGEWHWHDDMTTAQRRKAGWRIWTTQGGRYGSRRHLCPHCTVTTQGERPPAAGTTGRESDG